MTLPIGPISDLYGDLTPGEQSIVRSTLSQYVPTAVDQAATAIEGLGPSAKQAIQALSSNNAVTAVEGTIPLISGALALIPAFGLAAAGVVAAGGEAFSLLANALGLGAVKQDTCGWVVGGVCFNMQKPSGPSDTGNGDWGKNGWPGWIRIEDFARASLAMNGAWHSHDDVPVIGNYASWLDVAFPSLPGWELWQLGDHVSPAAVAWRAEKAAGGWKVDEATGETDNGSGVKQNSPARPLAGTPAGQFLMAFYRAYVRSLEFPINGYQQPDPYLLAKAVAGAWNNQHSPSKVFTFDGKGDTFLDSVIKGGGTALEKIEVNVGPQFISIHLAKLPLPQPVKKALPMAFHLPSPAAIIESAKPNLTPQQYATLKAHWETPPPAPAPATYSVLGLKVPKTYAKVGGVIAAGAVALKLIF